jgi:hypothetical protein
MKMANDLPPKMQSTNQEIQNTRVTAALLFINAQPASPYFKLVLRPHISL